MFARVTMTQAALDRADEAVRVNKERVIPGAEGIAGFKGSSTPIGAPARVGLASRQNRYPASRRTAVRQTNE